MGDNRERSLNRHPDIYIKCICNLSKEIQISIHRKLRNERDKMRMTTRSVQNDCGFMVKSYVVTVQSCKHGLICQCHVILTQLVDAYIFQWTAGNGLSPVRCDAMLLVPSVLNNKGRTRNKINENKDNFSICLLQRVQLMINPYCC